VLIAEMLLVAVNGPGTCYLGNQPTLKVGLTGALLAELAMAST
jgi:hypothetical protein